jgi:hypothetical protein
MLSGHKLELTRTDRHDNSRTITELNTIHSTNTLPVANCILRHMYQRHRDDVSYHVEREEGVGEVCLLQDLVCSGGLVFWEGNTADSKM